MTLELRYTTQLSSEFLHWQFVCRMEALIAKWWPWIDDLDKTNVRRALTALEIALQKAVSTKTSYHVQL